MAKVTAKEMVKFQKKYVGVKENPPGSNCVIFNTHYYGRKVSGSSYPWCCAFQWDMFRMIGAPELFCGGGKTAYCPTVYNYYKSKGKIFAKPKVGDLVLYSFDGSSLAGHIGLVCEVTDDTHFKAVEGNTSVTSDDNGGSVMVRDRTTSQVLGFARPDYKSDEITQKEINKQYQKALGISKVDGDFNENDLNKTISLSRSTNSKNAVVKPLQKWLKQHKFYNGNIDCIYGPQTEEAVKAYQKKKGIKATGKINKADATWKKLVAYKK